MIAVVAACAGSDSSPTSTPEPVRTDIRAVNILPDAKFPDANFSAILPEGWAAVDTIDDPLLRMDRAPTGILSKFGEPYGRAYYAITPANSPGEYRVPTGYVREHWVIDGVNIDWIVPIDASDDEDRLRLFATFASIPGDPDESFGLTLRAYGLSTSQFHELKQIVESFRLAPPPPLAEPPEPEVTPGPDWQRVEARWTGDGPPRFSVLAPPGTTFEPSIGYDSLIGTFTVGNMEIFFDFGNASSGPLNPDGYIRYDDEAEHDVWVEVIDGKAFTMFRPASVETNRSSHTGITVPRLPGLPDLVVEPSGSYSSSILSCGGSFWTSSIDRDEQELALAILRTITDDAARPRCN